MRILWKECGCKGAYQPGRSHLTGPHAFPVHSHDFYEFFWLVRGRATHLINGRSVPIRPGNLVFIHPDDKHGFRSDGEGFVIHNLAFRRTILKRVMDRHFCSDDIPWSKTDPVTHHTMTPEHLLHLQEFYDDALEGPWDQFGAERLLLNLLHLFRKRAALTPATGPTDSPDWLESALSRWRENNRFLDGGTEILALLACRSPEHVARTLRASRGSTPTAWLNDLRMHHAAQQLTVTNRTILDIAGECGFESLGHFYAVFRAAHGHAPNAHRKRYQRRPI